MESEALCIPCIIRQCQRIALLVSPEERVFTETTKLVLDLIGKLSLKEPPSLFTSRIIMEVYKLLNTPDPFTKIKEEMQELGKKSAEMARKIIDASSDPIYTALKFACAGNIIDIGPQKDFDLKRTLQNLSFARDDYKIFKEKLKGRENLLYILDNAGEIYFDKILIEKLITLNLKVKMVVKERPILNDATLKEAKEAGLFALGEVLTTGSGFLGVNFAEASQDFLSAYENAEIVIAKGHANFESLVDQERDGFFLLKAKCPVVANRLGIEVGASAFYYSPVKFKEE
ncbi:MAG: ARMT1-like domain-containing protein [candidate division WOR-3 bacterium]